MQGGSVGVFTSNLADDDAELEGCRACVLREDKCSCRPPISPLSTAAHTCNSVIWDNVACLVMLLGFPKSPSTEGLSKILVAR
eukprot:4604014-Amphidinium_carterae.1